MRAAQTNLLSLFLPTADGGASADFQALTSGMAGVSGAVVTAAQRATLLVCAGVGIRWQSQGRGSKTTAGQVLQL